MPMESDSVANYSSTSESNQLTYSDSKIVSYYQYLSQLQPAEQTILGFLRPLLAEMKMLDLGVGGGRTTRYFAPLVKEYIGVDYAKSMVAACKEKYRDRSLPVTFRMADARNLEEFDNGSFDLVLFSFNGMDYVDHYDRISIVKEIARVTKPGGYYCFSTHNLLAMRRQFDYRSHLSINPLKSYTDLVMYGFLRFLNRGISLKSLQQSQYAVIRDESHNFRLQTYYITPEAQTQQLAPYFKNITVYSWQIGEQIDSFTEDEAVTKDMWLYYLCQRK